MKKPVLIFVIAIALIATIIFIIQKNKFDATNENGTHIEETKLDEKEVLKKLQVQLQTEGLGFIVEAYSMQETGYLVIAKQRDIEYEKEFPGDQLIWAVSDEEGFKFDVLSKGDHKIHLVLDNDKKPYYLSGSKFLFSFYEGNEINGTIYKGKGYVYEAEPKGKVKKTLETKGEFYDFGFNKEKSLMFIEKIEANLRNRYPSYFAPYVLYHKQWKNGKWVDIKQQEVTPDVKKEHEKLIETFEGNEEKEK